MRGARSWWGRHRLDVLLLALLVAELAAVLHGDAPAKVPVLVLTALSVLVFLARRWHALAVSVAAFAALTAALAVQPRFTAPQFFGVLAAFAVAGAVNRGRHGVLAWSAGAAMLAYAAWGDPYGGGWADFGLSLAFGTTMWGAGLLVARRNRAAAEATARAERAELERERAAHAAVAEERAAIARELHDLVSHGLSVVVVQALAARAELEDLGAPSPAETERLTHHLDAIEATARDALGEMRRMLGLLQTSESACPAGDLAHTATPGLTAISALVERGSAGCTVERVDVDTDLALAPGLALAVYRVVQEALTNVVRHAPGSSLRVTVDRRGEDVVAEVTNGPASRSSVPPLPTGGRGLVGLAERAAVFGGTLSSGPTRNGGYRVTACFPTPLPDADLVQGARHP